MNVMLPPPLSVIYDLSDLSDAGAELTIAASPEQRARLADWVAVQSVDSFEAQVTLKRLSASRFEYQAELSADIVQSCVVTLEPVPAHLVLPIARSLHLIKFPRKTDIERYEVSPASDEAPEQIDDTHYDIAGPLLEEFSLAIDPYPRAPGVAFEALEDEGVSESPFAVLKRLKGKN